MNTDKKTPEEVLGFHLEEGNPTSIQDSVDLENYVFKNHLLAAMKEYGQQERELQKKEDDLAIHAAYNYGYKRGKKEANEWVSVKDSPPPYDTPVMVWCEIYGRYIGTLVEIHKSGYGNWHDGKVLGVLPPIFWQPLPAPPQQGKEENNGK